MANNLEITEKEFHRIQTKLHYKDNFSTHELIIALSQVTYEAVLMKDPKAFSDEEKSTINKKWRKDNK
tara:strand:+ start:182 stop:385 length:204 start_codon:yes stop_codon:yes gene_type:complete